MRVTRLIPAAAIGFVGGWVVATHRLGAPPTPSERHEATRAPLRSSDRTDNVGTDGAAESIDFERAWSRARQNRDTAAGRDAMRALLEKWAQVQPDRAMALALRETNIRWRAELRRAALRGWAMASPRDALAFAMRLPEMDNRVNVEAVLLGAAVHPDEAVAIGRQVIAGNPELAADYGESLIQSLSANGAFDAAVRFASEDTSLNRAGWV